MNKNIYGYSQSKDIGKLEQRIEQIEKKLSKGSNEEYSFIAMIKKHWIAILALIAAILPEQYKVALWKWFWNVLDAASTMPQ